MSRHIDLDDPPEAAKPYADLYAREHEEHEALKRTCSTLRAEVSRLRRQLCDLLARAHRDGGHYTEAVGIDRSVQDAHDAIAANLDARAEADALRKILDTKDNDLGPKF